MLKGKFHENGQYDHQAGQLPTQTLVNPKNLCFIDSSMLITCNLNMIKYDY